VLTVSQVTKSFGGRILFEEASLQVNRADRVGLVGPNGAGKSTLFSLVLGENSPDTGSVTLQRGTKLGFLPQESAPVGLETVLEIASGATSELAEALAVLRRAREAGDEDSDEVHHANDVFREQDGHKVQAKARRILAGLAFRESDLEKPARELSGGWIMRCHLARLLTMEPDLLMLDEPTNHLDLESLNWFQTYLRTFPGAILMISHDRSFLNALCGSIVEIRSAQLFRYRGDYDAYLVQKAARDEQQLAAYKNQQREIERLQEFVDRFRAKASKAAQAQDKMKQIARMKRIEPPEDPAATIKFQFPQPARSGQKSISLVGVSHAYGEKVVYRHLDFTAERGQRTVLVGPNGAGKSTLIKLLAGTLPIQSGERIVGHQVTVGYFSQHRTETLKTSNTILAEVMDIPRPVPEQTARTVLGSFLFKGDDVFKTVGVLSGGEKSRLALVKLLLDPPNLLLMDEPTTHLDMASIEALIGALRQYQGTLLFVSHDVYFIRSIASTVLHINAGKLTPYAGDYQYYLDRSQPASATAGLVAPGNHQPPAAAAPKPTAPEVDGRAGYRESRDLRRQQAAERQASQKREREQKARASKLEAEIFQLEQRQNTLVAELGDPEVYGDRSRSFALNRELAEVSEQLTSLTSEWESIAESLQASAIA